MKSITGILLSTALVCPILSNAQNEVDALRYSQITIGGTARSVAMGGSFGALGADFSTMSTNPGGMGLYRKSEWTVTPSVFYQRSETRFNGSGREDEKYNFNFNNWGIVLSNPIGKSDDTPEWKYVNFAVGYNRYNNFNNRMRLEGTGTSSLLNAYVNQSQGADPTQLDQFGAGLAFDTYLMDTLPGYTNYYFTDIVEGVGGQIQRKSTETSGGMGETVLGLSGNYADKLFIGGTFGFPTVRYFEDSRYEEEDVNNSIGFFDALSFNQSLTTRGTGFNFKGGLVFMPTSFVRLGAAVHTPTFFSLRDSYSSTMTGAFDNGQTYTAESPAGTFNYKLKTPMRAIGSVGFVIKKIALLSAEYEYVDYTTAKLRSSAYSFFNENDEVKRKYNGTGNLRTGLEIRLDQFALRGGYAMYGNPFKSGINNGTRNNYTFGAGYRSDSFFIDFACVVTQANENFYLYDPSAALVNPAQNKLSSSSFLLTVGSKF